MRAIFLPASGLILLAGCESSTSNDGPVGVTAEEAQMLDDAAEMLDERQANFDQVTPQQQAADDPTTQQ